MSNLKFQRTIEDFVCENCGHEVVGDGYTNHCPQCLWSKHVDIHPGDRAEECGSLMEPLYAMLKKNTYVVVHRCVTCHFIRNTRTSPNDNFEVILELVENGQGYAEHPLGREKRKT